MISRELRRYGGSASIFVGLAFLVVFLVLVHAFLAHPGYGPCPYVPPCASGPACVPSSCPAYYASLEIGLLIAGSLLLAAGLWWAVAHLRSPRVAVPSRRRPS